MRVFFPPDAYKLEVCTAIYSVNQKHHTLSIQQETKFDGWSNIEKVIKVEFTLNICELGGV